MNEAAETLNTCVVCNNQIFFSRCAQTCPALDDHVVPAMLLLHSDNIKFGSTKIQPLMVVCMNIC